MIKLLPTPQYIQLLQDCHAYLREAEVRTPDGSRPVDRDALAMRLSNFLNQVNTHSNDCWSWGPQHYMCAYRRVKELEDARTNQP